MVDSLTEGRHGTDDDGRWVALSEVGSILRAILLAAVALAIGWAASAWLDSAGFRAPVATTVLAQ